MIEILDKTLCCGCASCVTACPKNCITLHEDKEGFLYPKVDRNTCVNCGLCEKVCHELHPYEKRKPQKVLAVINKDEAIRMASSSGGIFYLLAEKTVSEGGVVFGARFDEHWQVTLDYAETLEDIRVFMGSKYVQARTGTAYNDAAIFLKQGRKVLFSGSPCQIAGLHHYLRKEYNNLTTVDFVCHGVPSPKVWERYLNEIVMNVHNINDVKFRNKNNGWKKFNFVLSYDKDGKNYTLCSYHQENHYMRAFLSDMILRPSCHECKAKEGRSNSDITIADFWGVDREIPEMDDDKGTGLVLVNTDKGYTSLDWNKVKCEETNIEIVLKYNKGLAAKTIPHPKREQFFALLDNSSSVVELVTFSLRPPFKKRIRLTGYKRSLKKFLMKLTWGGNQKWIF